jgi:uncharacterized protein
MSGQRSAPAPSLLEAIDAFERGDFRAARTGLEAAAARQDPVAISYLAMLTWMGKGGLKANPSQAVGLFRKAAEAGLASAQVNLALAYLHGAGVPQDDREARHWFDEAAHRRAPAGLFYLGEFAANGRGEPQNPTKARELWLKASERGFAPAMRAFGAACADGRGGPADAIDGLAWLYAAAAGGEADAATSARFLAQRMRAKDITLAHKRGKALAKRFARATPWADEPIAR